MKTVYCVKPTFDGNRSHLYPRKHRRPAISEEGQPVKNRNLSRLSANLSRLNWSGQRNCVDCLSTVFTLLQQQEVPSVWHSLPQDPFLPCASSQSSLAYISALFLSALFLLSLSSPISFKKGVSISRPKGLMIAGLKHRQTIRGEGWRNAH